jgi:hypothetical protein
VCDDTGKLLIAQHSGTLVTLRGLGEREVIITRLLGFISLSGSFSISFILYLSSSLYVFLPLSPLPSSISISLSASSFIVSTTSPLHSLFLSFTLYLSLPPLPSLPPSFMSTV